jgi:glycosyltransferase involved in cell wall biosynthesis
MRVLLWHGWLLEGSGSNVYTARTAEAMVKAGHDVLVLCQEPRPERFRFVRAAGTVGPQGVGPLQALERPGSMASRGAVLLRPDIGTLLPVFVMDEYPGFEVKRFVDLSDAELAAYLERNVRALNEAARWHRAELVVMGHVVPGAVIGVRALGPGAYVTKTHGSDIEYAIREDPRYLDLATEGLAGARFVTGAGHEVLQRLTELVPSIADRARIVPPGVDVDRFRPVPRKVALETVADLLDAIPPSALAELPAGSGAGRRSSGLGPRVAAVDDEVRAAMEARNGDELEGLARRYDQALPDADAATRLRALSSFEGPVVGYLGKLIPQKGVHLLLAAMAGLPHGVRTLIVGFGLYREWLTALTLALGAGDQASVQWVCERARMRIEVPDRVLSKAVGFEDRVEFTGRLDHRYAPYALAAMDVLVVPSILDEAFGMAAAEGAAAGALPLVARHSGLAEVVTRLETAAGRPDLFSYEPGPNVARSVAEGITKLLSLPRADRDELRQIVSEFVHREWNWDRTAALILDLAQP